MKRISILFIIIALMIGVSGCMNNSFDVKNTSSNELVDYMNEKYDDKFSYKAPFGGGAGATTKQIIVTSKKYPDYDIWVEYSYSEDQYYDNYTDYKFKEDYEHYLEDEIKETLSCQAIVRREIATSGSYMEFDKSISFKEYMNTKGQVSDFTAVIKNANISDKEKLEQKLSSIFDKHISGFYGNIFFINNNEDLNAFFELDISGMDEHLNVFVQKASEEATSYEWR